MYAMPPASRPLHRRGWEPTGGGTETFKSTDGESVDQAFVLMSGPMDRVRAAISDIETLRKTCDSMALIAAKNAGDEGVRAQRYVDLVEELLAQVYGSARG